MAARKAYTNITKDSKQIMYGYFLPKKDEPDSDSSEYSDDDDFLNFDEIDMDGSHIKSSPLKCTTGSRSTSPLLLMYYRPLTAQAPGAG